jgi:hyaluronan synthase
MAFIKIYALLTLRTQRWGTRQVAVENGEVVRTGTDDKPSAEIVIPVPALAGPDTERVRIPA